MTEVAHQEIAMLYRNPEIPHRRSLSEMMLSALSHYRAGRRRRLATLDLLSMNDHLRRDLGLESVELLHRR